MIVPDEWRGKKWIGIDLDGTLAFADGTEPAPDEIGPPIPLMADLVHKLVELGVEVRLFTARRGQKGAIPHIRAWLKEHDIPITKITNVKDWDCACIFDDKAVGVVRNTGYVGNMGLPFVTFVGGDNG